MATDRFIRWSDFPRPSKIDLMALIDEYVGTGFGCRHVVDRSFITIPGEPSSVPHFGEAYNKERFVEVFRAGHVSVITRQADPLTAAIADGLVKFICFRTHGSMDMPK